MIELETAAPTIVAWALTFAIHSTILLCGAWLLDRALRDRPEIMSPVWKTAALGGLLTATVQLAAGVEPLGGRVHLGGEAHLVAAEITAPLVRPRAVMAMGEPIVALADVAIEPIDPPLLAPSVPAETVAAPPPRRAPANPTPRRDPFAIAAGLALLGALLGLGSIARAWWSLRRQLRGRRAADGVLARLLTRLLARARRHHRVRLSISPSIAVPLATGIVRPEIVVPERALASLAAAAQESMLAHELAHVLRRDPAWRLALLVLERVLFFQPLLRLARRRIAQHAEYLSDAWAVDNTAQPLELARCLTEIAGWVQRSTPALAAGMAEPRSILGQRVLRLVAPRRAPARAHALPWLAGAGLFAMVMVAPAIGSAHGRAHVMRHAAGAGAPMIVVVHEDGRAAGELETSPPGLPARAAVVVASDDRSARPPGRKAARKAERAEAKRRHDTEVALRRAIRAAHAQDRLPTVEELTIVLGEGRARAGDDEGERVVVVVDGDMLRGLAELDDIDVDIDDEAIAIAMGHGHGRGPGVAAHGHAAKAHAKQIKEQARRMREHARRVEDLPPELQRRIDRARAQADAQRRAAEHMRERAEAIEHHRERASEEYLRARIEAERARHGRRRHPPGHRDIVPIVAPGTPMPPAPAFAPLPPAPPMAPGRAFAPIPPAPPLAPMAPPQLAPGVPAFAPLAPAPPAPPRAPRRHRAPPGITVVVAS